VPDAPLAFDLFLIVMLVLLPVMGYAIAQVRRGRVRRHAQLMGASFVLFLVALIGFEWTARTMDDRPPLPAVAMTIHLVFAIPALVLWAYQIATAKKVLSNPGRHAKLGRAIFALLVVTVGTGIWVFWAMFG